MHRTANNIMSHVNQSFRYIVDSTEPFWWTSDKQICKILFQHG